MTDGVRVPDLTVVRAEVIGIATAAGVLTLDGAHVSDEVPAVTLSSVEHVAALLRAGANVLYISGPPLSLSDADAWLAERCGPKEDLDDSDDLPDWDTAGPLDPADDEASDDEALHTEVLARVGDVPLLRIGVLYGGVLHGLTQFSDWYRALEDRAQHLIRDRVEATHASIARMDEARRHALETFKAWFDALPDRLDTDEAWLALTTEPSRKQYVRQLAESELAAQLMHVDGNEMRSAVSQSAAIAAGRRKQVIDVRTAAVANRLPDLAAGLAATPGFGSAAKRDRERLAREHIKAWEPLATPHVHAGRLAELALAVSRGEVSAEAAPAVERALAEPGLF